jgi:hypothetical protein
MVMTMTMTNPKMKTVFQVNFMTHATAIFVGSKVIFKEIVRKELCKKNNRMKNTTIRSSSFPIAFPIEIYGVIRVSQNPHLKTYIIIFIKICLKTN